MQRNKLIILSIGTTILTILVVLMIFLERDQTTSNAPESNIAVSDSQSSEVDKVESNQGNSLINSQNEENSHDNNDERINGLDENEVRDYAQKAIAAHNLNNSATEMTEETLYAHSLLYQDFKDMLNDESSTNKDDATQNAKWISIELMGWHDHATEYYQFRYSEDQFLDFLEDENRLEDQDMSTSILFEELNNINKDMYIRQLESHFLKSYIWENIENEVSSNMSEDFSDLDEEEKDYQAFLAFEQELTNDLFEKNPNLFESE